MSKKYQLIDPGRAAYFVQAHYDGTYSALQATSMEEAIERVTMMTDFELAVDKRRFWQGQDKEEACNSEMDALRNNIVQLNGQQVLEHAEAGHGYALRWGWVKEI